MAYLPPYLGLGYLRAARALAVLLHPLHDVLVRPGPREVGHLAGKVRVGVRARVRARVRAIARVRVRVRLRLRLRLRVRPLQA